jgi:hypothetical protein
MKSRKFTLGLLALILTQLLSFKTFAQCCVAPVNLTQQLINLFGEVQSEHLYWQRVQEVGCITPVKYRVEYSEVGQNNWISSIINTPPNAKEGRAVVPAPHCNCEEEYEWRVQGICSDTTAFVYGQNFILKGNTICHTIYCGTHFTASSASTASSQGKFTATVYPNPVAGELKLSGNLKAGGPVNVQIMNSVGQTVLRQDYNFNSGDFNTGMDVSKLPPGVYLVVVNDKTERAALSIVKQ